MHGITVVHARLGVQIAQVTNKVEFYIQVHGECETVVTRFWLVPLLWQLCYRHEDRAPLLPLLSPNSLTHAVHQAWNCCPGAW